MRRYARKLVILFSLTATATLSAGPHFEDAGKKTVEGFKAAAKNLPNFKNTDSSADMCKKLADEMNNLHTTMDQYEKDKKNIKDDKKRNEDRLAELNKKIGDLQKKIDELKKPSEPAKAVESGIAAAQQEIDSINRIKEEEELKQKIELLEHALASVNADLDNAKAAHDKALETYNGMHCESGHSHEGEGGGSGGGGSGGGQQGGGGGGGQPPGGGGEEGKNEEEEDPTKKSAEEAAKEAAEQEAALEKQKQALQEAQDERAAQRKKETEALLAGAPKVELAPEERAAAPDSSESLAKMRAANQAAYAQAVAELASISPRAAAAEPDAQPIPTREDPMLVAAFAGGSRTDAQKIGINRVPEEKGGSFQFATNDTAHTAFTSQRGFASLAPQKSGTNGADNILELVRTEFKNRVVYR